MTDSSQVPTQDVDSNQLQYGSSLDNAKRQSLSSSSSIGSSTLGKQPTKPSISSHLKKKTKGIFNAVKKRNSPSETDYQARADYLLFRK